MSTKSSYLRQTVWINVFIIIVMLFSSIVPTPVQAGYIQNSDSKVTSVKSADFTARITAKSEQMIQTLQGTINRLSFRMKSLNDLTGQENASVSYYTPTLSKSSTVLSESAAQLWDVPDCDPDVLVPFIPGQDSTTIPNVFFECKATYNFTDGGVLLSSTPDGLGYLLTDDQINLTVRRPDGSLKYFYSSFLLNAAPWIAEKPPVDITYLFQPGENEVLVQLTDVRRPNYWTRAYYLVPTTSGTVDLIAPIISNVTWRQDGKGSTVVMATITDNVMVEAASLWWNDLEYPMQLIGPDRYYAIVPGQTNGIVGRFSITAVDPSGNLAVWPSDGTTSERIRYLIWAGLKTNTLLAGEPVNTATGNFYTRHQDIFAPGPGMPFTFERSYNSIAGGLDGPLGFGWTHNFNMHLQVVDDPLLNGVVVTYADGRIANFEADGSEYKSPEGVRDILAHEGSGFVLTQPDQVKYHFDANGKLTSKEDRNHNQIVLSYTGDDLAQILDTAGRAYTLEYVDHRIVKITDVMGRTYEYTYEDGNLAQYKDPEGGLLKYSYNAEHWMLSITDPNGRVFVSNTYDDRGRVTQQLDASGSLGRFEYVDEHHVKSWDYDGNLTEHFYDDKLRAIQEIDALGNSTYYSYDDDDNVIKKTDKGGHDTEFTYDANGNMLTRKDSMGGVAEFRYDVMNNLTYKKDEAGYETIYEYDTAGNLVHIHEQIDSSHWKDTWFTVDSRGLKLSEADANGNTTQFAYDGQGNLIQVTDALGQTAPSYEYDLMGRQTAMIDGNNNKVSYTYDGNDRRIKITDPKGEETVFTYDGVGNLKTVTDRRGFTTTYIYNENDSLVELIDARGNRSYYTYDKMYHRLTYRNPSGYVTEYAYDSVYNLVEQKDAKGNITRFEYDADGLLIKQTDALGQVKTMQYDALHRLWKAYDEMNRLTEYKYDAVGNLIKVTNAKGGITEYNYDGLKRQTQVKNPLEFSTTFEYDPAGNLTVQTDANGNRTEFFYDALNQRIHQVDALGRTISWTYDPVGNVLSQTDARGYLTLYLYDENDNLIKVTDALNGVVIYTYDEEGNRLTETDQNGNTTTYTYDQLGKVLSIQLPLGHLTVMTYDENSNLKTVTNAKGKTVIYTYDETDLLKTTTTALGFVTSYDYDGLGRKTRMVDAEGNPTDFGYDLVSNLSSVRDALDGITRYEYDPLGNLTAQIDANSHRTDFKLDLIGQVLEEKNPIGSTWKYEYDPVGNRIRRVDANGVETRFTFDAGNRMTEITYPSEPQSNVLFGYDANDNITEVNDPSGKLVFAYDALNRMTKVERAAGILAGKVLTFAYDAAGNRTQMGYPEGVSLVYAYNANDWLTSISNPMGGYTTYTYDPVGLATLQQNPNNTWTEMAYDDDNRLVRLFNGKPSVSQDLISSFDYTLDKVGNRVRTVEKVITGQVESWDKVYTYDDLYRLTQSVFTSDTNPKQVLTSSFRYDAVGNRLSMISNIQDKPNTPALPKAVTTGYTYNSANQMLTAGATKFTYDANGNRVKMNGAARVINYSYDVENRLSGAVTYDVLKGKLSYDTTLDFTYDGLGRRVQRGIIEKGVRKTASFLYDYQGFDLLAQYVAPGGANNIFYYRDQLKALSQHALPDLLPGEEQYYHYDGLGNVSAWTNQAGAQLQEYMYAPYGQLIDNNGPDNTSSKTQPLNHITFSGKMWDRELETNYFGARDYDPNTGVWLSQDVYRGGLTEPLSQHRYAYVNNNPTSLIDKYGYYGEYPNGLVWDHTITASANQMGMTASSQLRIIGTQNNAILKSLTGGSLRLWIDSNGNLVAPGLTFANGKMIPSGNLGTLVDGFFQFYNLAEPFAELPSEEFIYVSGYTRANGTYVSPYLRTVPGGKAFKPLGNALTVGSVLLSPAEQLWSDHTRTDLDPYEKATRASLSLSGSAITTIASIKLSAVALTGIGAAAAAVSAPAWVPVVVGTAAVVSIAYGTDYLYDRYVEERVFDLFGVK